VRRFVVLGGRGFFGAAAVDLLRRDGFRPLVGSRRPGADLHVDVEDVRSLRRSLRAGDIVIDAAGPFQQRTMALAMACLEVGVDLIDLSDSLDYVTGIQQIGAGSPTIRLLPACSSVSALSAALVRLSGVQNPVRLSAILAPATGNTSTPATAASLLSTLRGQARVLRDGRLVERRPFADARVFSFPHPVGVVRARLAESPDAVTLPLVWTGLRDIDFWIAPRRRLLELLFTAAALSHPVHRLVRAAAPAGRRLTKRFGVRSGGFGVEVEDASGRIARLGFVHHAHSYLIASVPAVLAAKAIAAGTFSATGVVPADRHVDPIELREYLRRMGIRDFGLDLRLGSSVE
jgi:saccharopine dehydrogenase-like NADP-dependent oxidoreductase